MEEKKKNSSSSSIDQASSFIKSLGGAKAIYSFLTSKNININIESIYKWKNNGIPHRYLLYIKELADNQSIIIPKNFFPDNISSMKNKSELISSIKQKNKNIKINRISILLILLVFIIIILQFLYYQSSNKAIKKQLLELENTTSAFQENDYNKKLDSINDFIKIQNVLQKKYSSDIKKIYNIITTNNNKLIGLEENISDPFNNDQIQNFERSNFNTTLINLIVLKDNIKFSIPNLSNINLINDYFSNVNTPADVTLSLSNLNSLSNSNLKTHKKLIQEIPLILLNNDNDNDKSIIKKNNKSNILSYLKNIIKISKINDNHHINNNLIKSNIINHLNGHNYDYILKEFESVNYNIELNEWLNSINNLNILIISIDNIINWLIYKG